MSESTLQCIQCQSKEATRIALLRPQLLAFAHRTLGAQASQADAALCQLHLNELRSDYVRAMLSDELGELGKLEEDVLSSFREQNLLAASLASQLEKAPRTVGNRASDSIAAFGGSWSFVIAFVMTIVVWILFNVVRAPAGFDPYPFILLNLILSCVAALQAPIIMMSQRRQEQRDRGRAESDYQINLKAELEIRHLNEKMDHLLHHNAQRLLEIQSVQTDLLREISKSRS